MVASHLASGARAEELAAQFIVGLRVRIIARNLRCRRDEVDIAGWDGDILALIEVRQRRRADFGGALGLGERRQTTPADTRCAPSSAARCPVARPQRCVSM